MPSENYFQLPLRVAESLGLEPTVFTLWDQRFPSSASRFEIIDGIGVRRFKGSAELLLALRDQAPRLVHGHSYGWVPSALAPYLSGKYIFTAHSADNRRHPVFIRKALNHLLAKSTIFIALSQSEARDFQPYLGDRIRIIPHPVDIAFFGEDDPATETRLREQFDHAPLIFAVGNLTPVKNFETLLIAFERVHKEYPLTRLVIAGASPKFVGGVNSSRKYSGQYLPSLLQLAARLGLTDCVSFVGHLPPQLLRAYFHIASAYVHTSLRECQSLSTGEAAAAGTPLVLSNIPVFREYYADAALFFERGNAGQLEQQLLRVMSEPSSMKGLSSKAHDCVRRFDPKLIFQSMRRAYEQCLT